jgi:uncharacterized protein YjbI with pentapeptide repeats
MSKENKENFKMNVCQIKDCGRPTHKESKYCIFHVSAEEKTIEDFKRELKKYVNKIKKEDGDYDFKKFIFVGDINFKEDLNITVFKNVDFENVIFKGITQFDLATFEGVATFNEATFEGSTHFSNAAFVKDANFLGATFMEYISFDGSTFKGNVDFKFTNFEKFAMFTGITFKRDTKFDGTVFQGYITFRKTIFEGNVSFKFATLLAGSILEIETKKKGIIDLFFTKLENVFLDLNLDSRVLINFTGAILKNTKIKKAQIENHILQEKKMKFYEAQEIYLLLKNNFHSIGQYEDESWAFKKEKDMERKGNFHFKTLYKWLWSCFLNGIFGYGEQPGKVIVSAILIIILFAFLFTTFGIGSFGIEQITSNNFLDCLYFSTVTFTTLGYGDFRPLEGWGRILAGSEAFIGAFMMALFVYTFAKRTGGR